MATVKDMGQSALALPGVAEQIHFGAPRYHVLGKTFALYWRREARAILKLPPPRQELLFEARPQTFAPVAVARATWSYVALETISAFELDEFVFEAWTTVAPRRLLSTIQGRSMSRTP
jgi:hypothetical protein